MFDVFSKLLAKFDHIVKIDIDKWLLEKINRDPFCVELFWASSVVQIAKMRIDKERMKSERCSEFVRVIYFFLPINAIRVKRRKDGCFAGQVHVFFHA